MSREAIFGAVLGLVILAFLVTGIHGTYRRKMLEDRVDTICGPNQLDSKAGSFLENYDPFAFLQGLSRNRSQRAGIIVLLAVPFLVALAGWKVSVAAAALAMLAHFIFAKWQKNKQAREFADGLPTLLERVRRLVLIGNTLPQAFVEAVASANSPMKRRLEPLVRRIRHGASFPDSIDILAQQIDIMELYMLAAYVRTNTKFGGRVAQTLANLINQLASKRRLEREIKASTAETRASAGILFGLTALTMVLMSVLNPTYLDFFFASETGQLVLLAIVMWPLLGVLVMRRILVLDF